MNELVKVIAMALVDHPDEVTVTQTEENGETILHLHVSESDMGKVIGKQGKIARALRFVVKAAAVRADVKVAVDIV